MDLIKFSLRKYNPTSDLLCGMQNSGPGLKISPGIEQHKLHNTFNKNIYIYIFFFGKP